MSEIFPGADAASQWFADRLPGVRTPHVRKLVLHSTEGGGWPTYDGGGKAPNMTLWWTPGGCRYRQHFPAGMGSRALKNLPGGVETNMHPDGVFQVEMVGTTLHSGGHGMVWPRAQGAALDAVARVAAWLHTDWGLPLVAAARWPEYGTRGARFTGRQWNAFQGVCGHLHVPENDHLDPGDIDAGHLIASARAMAAPTPAPPEDDMQLNDTVYTASNGVNVTVGMCLAGAYKLASSPLISTIAADVAATEETVHAIKDAITPGPPH